MKKVFINSLPRRGRFINWEESVGYKVKFVYNNIQGEIKIVNYYKKENQTYLKIQYNFNLYDIKPDDFKRCHVARILGIKIDKYRYQVGNIITDLNSGKLQILEQIRVGKNNNKGYKYCCLICGNIDIISEEQLKKKQGCNVCCVPTRKILKGYNDMWTTNPNLAKLLSNPEDGYKYTQNSGKRVNWKCPNCKNIIKNKRIEDINKYGLSCPKCSDGISYPEKIMFNILQQLNIKFIYQYSPKWCKYKLNSKNKKGRYDFYFKINNNEYIVETDGGWHNKDNKISGQTKGESKYIDNIKDKLANNHKIEVIRIECNKSELKYIKNNIINKLNNIFNLNKIDWLKCHKYACNSLVKKACDLWQQKDYSTNKIGEILNISDGTIRNYLKQGTKLNWCQYNPKQIQKNNGKLFGNNGTKVICLNNKKIFNSVSEAKRYFKNNVNIINCCKNIAKYAGKDPITGDHLRWMYYDDYLIFKQKSQVINE